MRSNRGNHPAVENITQGEGVIRRVLLAFLALTLVMGLSPYSGERAFASHDDSQRSDADQAEVESESRSMEETVERGEDGDQVDGLSVIEEPHDGEASDVLTESFGRNTAFEAEGIVVDFGMPSRVNEGIAYYEEDQIATVKVTFPIDLDREATTVVSSAIEAFEVDKNWELETDDAGDEVWVLRLKMHPCETSSLWVRVFEKGEAEQPKAECVYGLRASFGEGTVKDDVVQIGRPFAVGVQPLSDLPIAEEDGNADAAVIPPEDEMDEIANRTEALRGFATKIGTYASSVRSLFTSPRKNANALSSPEVAIELPSPSGVYEGVRYYAAGFDAVITVLDAGFSAEGASVAIGGQPVAVAFESSGEGVHTATVSVSPDQATAASGTSILVSYLSASDEGDVHVSKESDSFVIDSAAPEIDVDFADSPTSRVVKESTVYYTAERVATITVKDELFDASRVTITRFGEEPLTGVTWSDEGSGIYTTTVKFSGNQKDAGLTVSGTDKAGNGLVAAAGLTTGSVVDGTFKTSEAFDMFVNPTVEVEYTPDSFDSEDQFFDVRETGTVKALITVVDPAFDAGKVTVAANGSTSEDPIALRPVAGSSISYTATVTFEGQGSAHGLVISTSDESRKLSGDVRHVRPAGIGAEYRNEGFTLDATPPTAEIKLSDAETKKFFDGTWYYAEAASAEVIVRDESPGSGIVVSAECDGNTRYYGLTQDEFDPEKYTVTVPLPAVAAETKTYMLKVSGVNNSGIPLEETSQSVVIDKGAPEVALEFAPANEESHAGGTVPAVGVEPAKSYFTGDVTVTARVTDMYFDASAAQVTAGGVVPEDLTSWNPDSENPLVHTARFTLNKAEDGTDKVIPVIISAADANDADNVNSLTQVVIIDVTEPVLAVAISPDCDSYEAAVGEANEYSSEIRYYAARDQDAPVNVRVHVSDDYLPQNGNDTLDIRVGEQDVVLDSANGYDAVVAVSATSSKTLTISASGTDLAGNSFAFEGADEVTRKALRINDDAENPADSVVYESRIVVDADAPVISSVGYVKLGSQDSVELAANTAVYSNIDLMFVATVDDAAFVEEGEDAGDTVVKLFDSNGTSEELDYIWRPSAGNEHYLAFTIPSSAEGEFSLTIATEDRVGNAANPEYRATVVIDKTKPKLKVDYVTQPAKIVPGSSVDAPEVRYFGIAENPELTPSFTVQDDYLDAACIEATVDDGTPLSFAKDDESGAWTASLEAALVDEGSYDVSVIVVDWAGNSLEVKPEEAVFEGSSDSESQYACRLVIDKTRPDIAATYQKQGGEQNDLPHKGETIYSNVATTVVATTSELNFDSELLSFETGHGVGKGVWVDAGNGLHTATLVLDTDPGTEATYTIRGSGTDLALNPLDPGDEGDSDAAEYESTVKVDKVAPTMRVDFVLGAGVRENVEQAGQTNEVRYCDGEVRARITVFDTSMGDGILVNGRAVPKDSWTSTAESTYVYEVTYAQEGESGLTVSGTDLAGNALVSADSATLVSNGQYSTRVVVDTVSPELSVIWGDTPTNGSYYRQNRSASVVVREQNFDPGRISVNGAPTVAGNWSQSGQAWTYTAPLTYTSDGSYTLRVEGTDRAGHVLVGGDDRSPAKRADSSGVYVSDTFVLDKTPPTVSLRLDQPLVRTVEGVDYFAAADELSVTVNVSDANFNPVSDAQGQTNIEATGSIAFTYERTRWNSGSYTLTFGENDSDHKSNALTATIYDLAGNAVTYTYGEGAATLDSDGTSLSGAAFSLDITAPAIAAANEETGDIPTVHYSSDKETYRGEYLFFNSPTEFQINVTDAVGIHVLELRKDETLPESPYVFANDESQAGATTRSVKVTLQEGTEFPSTLYLYAEDNAFNHRQWRINPRNGTVEDVTGSSDVNAPLYKEEGDLYPLAAIQDTTKPVLDLSGVEAGAYYNEPKTVRLALSELNFHYLQEYDGGQQLLKVVKREGNASFAESSWEPLPAKVFVGTPGGKGGVDYFATSTLSDDGHYSLSANLTDPAGNKADAVQIGEFTVDRTAPTVSVSFDNNSALNGMYYAAARTATIVITEHNFNQSDFSVETTGAMSGWVNDGDTHTMTVSFASDGRYTITVSGHDMAGNQLATYTEPEFVIDLTAPTITFGGVDEQAAYNGPVIPFVMFSDEANFDANGTSCTAAGTKNGSVNLPSSLASDGENGATQTFSDIGAVAQGAYDASSDDIYTLQASMTDLAGNSAQGSITFSVNRYGSNYRVLDEEAYERNEGYLLNAQEVLIQEVNVSGCESEMHGVTVTSGANVMSLERNDSAQNTGYVIEAQTSDAADSFGWASYVYRIASGNFDTDGRYYVSVNSDDRATNKNTSSNYFDRSVGDMSKAEVSFILDTTDPVITNLNIGSGETYEGDRYQGRVSVVDNLGIKGIDVTLDGSPVELTDDGYGNFEFAVDARSFTPRNLDVAVRDLAGREAVEQATGFHVTSDVLELHLPLVIGGGVVVLAIVATVVYALVIRPRRGSVTRKVG